jgi:hypothetical protein
MCIGKNYADHIKEVDTWKSAPGISTPDVPEVRGLLHLIAIAVTVVISEIWCGVKTIQLQSDLFSL